MIEYIDSYFFYYLKRMIQNNKLIVTADHTTSCQQKVHTADPVPVLTYPFNPKQKEQRFTEEDAKKGRKIIGRKLLEENFF